MIEPAVIAPEPRKRPVGWIVAAALGAVTLLIVAVVALVPKSTDPPITTVLPDAPDATPAAEPTATPIPELPVVALPPAIVANDIRITESDVGTGVINHRLVGQGTRFEEGSIVFFFSRAVGGSAGQTLQHVWRHEGRIIQSIELPVGSADWRTYSTKTLRKRGNWSVEARGADGRVLARADFTCEAP